MDKICCIVPSPGVVQSIVRVLLPVYNSYSHLYELKLHTMQAKTDQYVDCSLYGPLLRLLSVNL